MKMLRLFGVLILLCPILSVAQMRPGSIRGIVQDAKTGEAIPLANVVLKDTLGIIFTGATTDFDGKYNIQAIKPGIYNIEASFVGYQSKIVVKISIAPNAPTIQDFKLLESSDILQEVVIQSYSKPLIDKTKNSKVISSPNITNMAVRDATSVASQAAGVTQDSGGNVNVRGARAEGTVYFIDGVKVRGSNSIPNASIAQTEVITGGLPAQYGDQENPLASITPATQTSGGIFNFRKKKTKVPVVNPYPQESYSPIVEIPFRQVQSRPLSTFSSDVDVASYANVRRMIQDGNLPPKSAVRIEEMVNYFNYDYTQPEGDETFSVRTELAPCAWNKSHQLLRIGIKTKDIPLEELPANNLVFLIDVSGSMNSYDKLGLLKKSLRLMVNKLRNQDRVAIVVYASSTGLVLPSTSGKHKEKILRAINHLEAGGSTAGGAGIQLAYETALENFDKKANNRVILATDGDFNVGVSSEEGLVKLIEEKREDGVFLSVLGFGTGNYQDSKMEKLADNGNGNYAYIDNLMEAQKVLVRELGANLNVVAKDTKFQIEFNPNQVYAYRLIGYENRELKDEDFNDDTKDAGDVGSGHSVTAIYELIPQSVSDNPEIKTVDDLKYQVATRVPEELKDEIATVKIRHKKPDEEESTLASYVVKQSLEEPSLDFQFLSAVVEFGMLLRDSDYKGTSSFENVLTTAKANLGKDEGGYRHEFVNIVSLAKELHKNQMAYLD